MKIFIVILSLFFFNTSTVFCAEDSKTSAEIQTLLSRCTDDLALLGRWRTPNLHEEDHLLRVHDASDGNGYDYESLSVNSSFTASGLITRVYKRHALTYLPPQIAGWVERQLALDPWPRNYDTRTRN
jgi:hypothetical protein